MAADKVPLEVDCRAVKQRLDAGQPLVLLDCREPDEHEIVRLAAARLLPMSQLMTRVGELDDARDQPLVVFCHHGGRSMRVATWLRQQGFDQAQSMSGGIDRWAEEIDQTLARY
ncbi:MAG TPA: rhodanese-like domain-containing protein [Pirellulales bacterium]